MKPAGPLSVAAPLSPSLAAGRNWLKLLARFPWLSLTPQAASREKTRTMPIPHCNLSAIAHADQSQQPIPILQHKQWWSTTGPSDWMKPKTSQTNKVVPAQRKSCKSCEYYILIKSRLCTIGCVLPCTCLSANVVIYINTSYRLPLWRLLNTTALYGVTADTRKKKRRKVTCDFWLWSCGTQNQNSLPAVLEKLWVMPEFLQPSLQMLHVFGYSCHSSVGRSERSMKPSLVSLALCILSVSRIWIRKRQPLHKS